MRIDTFSRNNYQPVQYNRINQRTDTIQKANYSSFPSGNSKKINFGNAALIAAMMASYGWNDNDDDENLNEYIKYPSNSFLHKECLLGEYDKVKEDIEKYPSMINAKNNYGKTPLHKARKYSDIVELFLNNEKTDVNAQDNFGYTFLMDAIKDNYEDTIKLGLKCDRIDFTLKNHLNQGYSEFIDKIPNEELRIRARKVMQARLDGKDPAVELRTDLHKASESGDKAKVIELMSNPETNVNAEDFYGVRPIHDSVKHPDILKLYLNDERVDLTAKDDFGNSLLRKAFKENIKSYLMILTNHNYRTQIKQKHGK